ncbi:pyridoxal phosphate-dependent transferase [Kalaharituber pfeilii]|nr:pyridoxal phosphate-dependent transferase [Kalaharituber pfeilii]
MSYYKLPNDPRKPINESAHSKVAAWFLGPRAENFKYLHHLFTAIAERQAHARKNVYPHDKDFITQEIQDSQTFQNEMRKVGDYTELIACLLSDHSVPFWSPRYNAHMNMDTSLPSIMGYLTTMLYNPNNVAAEASPLTTYIETTAGLELCKMLGYNVAETADQKETAWGHITCDGSVANLESLWAARNLKFYPLSLKLATIEGGLKFLVDAQMEQRTPFKIHLCTGELKLFRLCSVWELLNLTPQTILDFPSQLFIQYGITKTFLESALSPYLIQTLGKDYLEKYFQISKPGKIFVPSTKHYSWPKGAAIVGIGSQNIITVPVDNRARMDAEQLDKKLAECILPEKESERTPVYTVVAVMGSTEHGAVDPLRKILEIRAKYQKKGLSFVVHCDAAWGGYFASMIRDRPSRQDLCLDRSNFPSIVPSLSLNCYTEEQLKGFPEADSITIDPHKSGYCSYPAGGLCYRDNRMRYLVTWTSPIVFHAGDEDGSIGVYGVEGSKPGAAPVGVWLSHQVIPLNYTGYGTLLGEATFSCTKLYCHWATMTSEADKIIVVPFNMLPTESVPNPNSEEIETQKGICNSILGSENADFDPNALLQLSQIGSDLMINALAVNFKIGGKVNRDVVEANYFNHRIFTRLSVSKPTDVVGAKPLFITSSSWRADEYGACLDNFKRRLGLEGKQDLYVLVNVTMSPWPAANDFLKRIAHKFKKVALEEYKALEIRNTIKPDIHGFVIQGDTRTVHLVHLPMFNMANHRYQAILTGDLPEEVWKKYIDYRKKNPGKFFTLANCELDLLPTLIKKGHFQARIDLGIPNNPNDKPLIDAFQLSNVKSIFMKKLNSNFLDDAYPEFMPFYLYGISKEEAHIEHILRASPNIQLNSECVTLQLRKDLSQEQLRSGVVALFTEIRERSLQPLQSTDKQVTDQTQPNFRSQAFNFVPGERFRVNIYKDWNDSQDPNAQPISEGTLTLGSRVYVDFAMINEDPAPPPKDDTNEAEETPDTNEAEETPDPLGRLELARRSSARAGLYPRVPVPTTSCPSPESVEHYMGQVAAQWGDWLKQVRGDIAEGRRKTLISPEELRKI